MKNYTPHALDSYLERTLTFLRDHWHAPETGCVAACLLSDIDPIYDVSRDVGHNLYSHAERNVLETYKRLRGHLPPKDSILVTTLSPCVTDTTWRVGESCSDVAAAYGISRLHVGLVDPDHKPHAHNHSFKITQTQRSDLAAQCLNLRRLFNLKAPRQPDGKIGRLAEAYKNKDVFDSVFSAKKTGP